MTDTSGELERMRAENAALNEQVKLLVQTEQRAYRIQNAREHELRRIRALGKFGIDLVALDTSEVFARTVSLMRECFALEHLALVDMAAARWPEHLVVYVRGLATAIVLDGNDGDREAEGVLAAAGVPRAPVCAILPLVGDAVVIAASSDRRRPVYREDPITRAHLPLLNMIVAHVRRVVEHRQLTEDLRARSAMLVEVNEKLEASLRSVEQAQAQLLQVGKMEAIGRLAGGVAHDFNNLLTVVLNHASLAVAALPPESPEAEDLQCVIRASTRAAEITSQLLALGRKSVQRRQHVDIGLIARELARVLADLLGSAVALSVEIEPGCIAFADRSQIEQVILNLVINARDATTQGGEIRLVVRRLERDEVRPRDVVAIEVIDEGIGMDEATRARIFEPFFTTKEPGHGTGLGLAVVYGIVSQTGGTISVESEVGVGSRFVVELPRAHAEAATSKDTRVASVDGARLLLVEDSGPIRSVATRILTRAGYRVHEACDGEDAWEAITRRNVVFDLLVTDLNMPRMGGLELVRKVLDAQPQARVLFMTGFSEELSTVSEQAPSISCMTKPFTPEQLLARVGEQLAR